MSLTRGTRLGHYEVVEPIGAGGMGEVYKATDTRLDREVAIKVLPPHWADQADVKERFGREAQIIASLNHPNICALHDIGEHDGISFLVMEHLDGETLAARLQRGPLTLDEALDIAVPIADALDQAHRRGVVHRDLKPANIMLADGGPKLLDFGIAKAPASAPQDVTTSSPAAAVPVPTTPLTTPGLLIGTLQYMAPEQLDGLEADARTDIFAFGVVLHEMITGKPAFEGKSQVLLISSIATADPPPLSSVEPATPPALEHVVRTCLAKDPNDRWQTARDLLAELRWIADGGAATGPIVVTPAARGRRGVLRVLSAVAAIVAAGLAVPAYLMLTSGADAPEMRYRLYLSDAIIPPDATDGSFAISPDGQWLAFVADEFLSPTPDTEGLYLGRLGSLTYERFPDTERASQPFWSADGREIGFVVGGTLKKVDATGGPPSDICPAPGFLGGTWNHDGTILFGSATGVYRVSKEGGTAAAVTTLEANETGHFWPHFLPDGERFVYLAWSADAGQRTLVGGSLGSADRVDVMPVESNVAVTSAGYLLFHREGTLYARAFDAGSLTVAGDPLRVADEVLFTPTHGRALFDAARDGTLVYFDASSLNRGFGVAFEQIPLQPTWVDWTGGQQEIVGRPGLYRGAEVSPDGTRVALHQHDDEGGDVWVIEPGNSYRRITFDPARDNSSPLWSPDSRDLVYTARRDDRWALYRMPANGVGTEELLFESDQPLTATSWSPDNQWIVFSTRNPATGSDLWLLPLDGSGEPQPIVATPANEMYGQISPDGRWLAYASNETVAERYEIYVQPFPSGAGRFQPTTDGGFWPRWHPSGAELFFLERSPNPIGLTTLSKVTIDVQGETFNYSRPQAVIRLRTIDLAHEGGDYFPYAIAPDGRRLLVDQAVRGQDTATAAALGPDEPNIPQAVVIARHWEAALKENR